MEMVTVMGMGMETVAPNHSGYHPPPNEGLHWPSRRYWDHHDKLPDLDLMILVYHLCHLLLKERPTLLNHTLTTHPLRSKDIPPNLALQRLQRRRPRLRLREREGRREWCRVYTRKDEKVIL
jgi:hypothetical protein